MDATGYGAWIVAGLKKRLTRFVYARRRYLKPLLPYRGPVLAHLDGFSMFVRLDDWAVGARIALSRRYEPHVARAFARHLRAGSFVIDVGANVGFYSLLAASRVGPAGQVLAIEPNATSCRLLRRSCVHNGLGQVQILECAASDMEETVNYEMDDSNGRIRHGAEAASELRVPAVVLDRTLAGLPRLDLVKIDVEGAEARVVRGMQGLLRCFKPTLFTEFSPYGLRLASAIEPGEFLAMLRDLGYELCMVLGDGDISPAASDEEILAAVPGHGPEHHIDLLARTAGRP